LNKIVFVLFLFFVFLQYHWTFEEAALQSLRQEQIVLIHNVSFEKNKKSILPVFMINIMPADDSSSAYLTLI